MQPIPDLHFLQLTQVVVQLAERRIFVFIPFHAAVRVQPGGPAEVEDILFQHPGAAGIDTGGFVVFIHQPFQVGQGPIAFGPGQGRRQVIDDHRLGAALGLGAFAWIVDDEGIEVGQGTQDHFGEAVFRQGQGLARQPFQVAVFSQVDHRVGVEFLPQPGIKRQVAVRRNQIRVMIGGLGVDVVSPGRLQADGDVAAEVRGDGEAPAIHLSRHVEGIAFRRPPPFGDLLLNFPGQAAEENGIVGQGQGFGDFPSRDRRIGRPGLQAADQFGAVPGRIVYLVLTISQGVQYVDSGGRRIQADAVAHAAVLVGIVGEDQRHLARPCGGVPEPGPVVGQFANKFDAVGHRLIDHDIRFRQLVAAGQPLEGHRPGQYPAIHFRQGDVHGDIPG